MNVVGRETGATRAEVGAAREIEDQRERAGRLAAVELNERAELGFEPAAKTETGEIVAFFGDATELEEGGEDRVGVRLGGEEQAEVESGVESGFEGFVGVVASDGGEELIDDGGAVIERTADARGGGLGWVGGWGGRGGVH